MLRCNEICDHQDWVDIPQSLGHTNNIVIYRHFHWMQGCKSDGLASIQTHISGSWADSGGSDRICMPTGAGILNTCDRRASAESFMCFMLSTVIQQYYAGQTFEYPLVEGGTTHRLPLTIDTLNGPEMDLSQLSDLHGTDALLRETGVIANSRRGARAAVLRMSTLSNDPRSSVFPVSPP